MYTKKESGCVTTTTTTTPTKNTPTRFTKTLKEQIEFVSHFNLIYICGKRLLRVFNRNCGEKKQEKSTFSSKSNNIIHKITFDYLNKHTEKRTKAMLFHPFNTINKMKSNKILTGY